MGQLYGSPLYKELTEALRAGDDIQAAAIIQRGIAQTTGAEQAAWKRFQWGRRWAYFATPDRWEEAWLELRDMLMLAPGDLDTQRDILTMSLSLVPYYERLAGIGLLIPLMRSNLPELLQGFAPRLSIGRTLLLRRLWNRAYILLRRSAESLENASPERLEAQKGYLCFIHSACAVAALYSGRSELALDHVTQAAAIDQPFRRNYLHPYWLYRAKAELALHSGRPADARTCIQEGLNRIAGGKHKLDPAQSATFDLLAARIARAEGNAAGFKHFAERALATCRLHQLAWSERTVRAVLSGEPY